MVTKELDFFDIARICDSGQCFRMEKLGDMRYRVMARDRCLEVEQQGKNVTFFCDGEDFSAFWEGYFDLDSDYGIYIERINPKDRYLTMAAQKGSGICILRQDLWEMIISFLISQQNHIARIRRCIENICRRYGKALQPEGNLSETMIPAGGGAKVRSAMGLYAFPTPEELARATEEELRECNLGYRAKYVLRAAWDVASGRISLEKISEMDYPEAKEELLKLYGAGDKVADCICLFALHQLQAFPVDTHIRQVLDQHYKRGFPKRRYKGMEGIMQQYIFYYELTKGE